MIAPFDVLPVLAGILLEERQYWRETAAANIATLTHALEQPGPLKRARIPGPKVPVAAIRAELREWTSGLQGALSGEFGHQTCVGCGHAVKAGELVIYFDVEGEAHARCMGVPEDQLHSGGRVTLSPEEIPEPEPGEPPHPGYAAVYESSPLYTDEQIARIADHGQLKAGPR